GAGSFPDLRAAGAVGGEVDEFAVARPTGATGGAGAVGEVEDRIGRRIDDPDLRLSVGGGFVRDAPAVGRPARRGPESRDALEAGAIEVRDPNLRGAGADGAEGEQTFGRDIRGVIAARGRDEARPLRFGVRRRGHLDAPGAGLLNVAADVGERAACG